jgi:hypothetical protein
VVLPAVGSKDKHRSSRELCGVYSFKGVLQGSAGNRESSAGECRQPREFCSGVQATARVLQWSAGNRENSAGECRQPREFCRGVQATARVLQGSAGNRWTSGVLPDITGLLNRIYRLS